MTTAAYTWADLDSMNAAHYARRPRYLVDAERNLSDAYAAEDALVDACADAAMLERAHRHSLECERLRREAWARWDGEKAEQLRRVQ
jgi:hypothetical protein